MTDNDIIKALDYCCGNIENNDEECNEDMCYQVALPESRDEGIRWCRQWLIKDALDLINRQKAEIERFEKEKDSKLVMCIVNDKDKIKSEAIKEFAERLKVEIINDTAYGCDCNQHSGYYDYKIKIGDISEYIDDIIKEMTEVKE